MENELFATDAAKSGNGRSGAARAAGKSKAARPAPENGVQTDPFGDALEIGAVQAGSVEASSEPAGGTPLMAAPTSPAATVAPPLPARVHAETGGRSEPNMFAGEGLRVERRFTKPGQDVFWGGYSGYFADPDGHPWEVAWNPHFPLAEDGTIQIRP